MERRPLGRSGLTLPPLVFGGNVFGWTADETTSFRLLDRLVEAGFNAIDTADIYSHWAPGHSGGESENVIGKWLKQRGRRDDVLILTKVGGEMPGQGKGLGRAWIKKEVEHSLKRLHTDHIDLYQSHFDDPDTPLAETMGAYAELIAEGKVRAVGASNYSAARLREALTAAAELGVPRYESLQPHYNLMEREGFEKELQPLCYEEGIGVITYFSLAAGFLTGKYRSEEDLGQSPRGNGVKKYLNPRGLAVLRALDEVSARHGVTQAQVAIAWLANRGGVTAPIASATKLEQLEDLLKAATLKLSAEDMAALDKASAPA
ncbi:aldo/keto reductase [Roseomonas gilardii]|uniref:Aldo/keto reductase n=1 Tax=Roseomonas gilardii TaxID=257708 RepID=A0ABU3MDB2_9PROT|nr:aldo/keto reductase [Roseomonas gilardii]MDT8330856.1 aldo/keto reductase [Roseomonas gilardii]PZR11595.1 MAG: alcohol dehydrogenase [Azospirillum brasilense]